MGCVLWLSRLLGSLGFVSHALIACSLLSACAGSGGRQGPYRGKTLAIVPLDTTQVKVEAWDDVVEGLPDDGGTISGPRILAADFHARFSRLIERRIAKAGLRLDTVSHADTASPVGSASPVDTASRADTAARSAAATTPEPGSALPASSAAGTPGRAADSTVADSASTASAPAVPPAAVAAPAPPAPRPAPDYVLHVRSLDVHRGKSDVLVPKVGNLTVAPLYFFGVWTLRDAKARVVSEGRFQCVVTTHRRASEAEWRKAYDEAARQVIAETPFGR